MFAGVLFWLGWRGSATILLLFSLACLWVPSTKVFSDTIQVTLESRFPPVSVVDSPAADAIVILGSGMGGVSPPRLSIDLNQEADRVLHGARLYKAGKAPVIIVSGGSLSWGGESIPPESQAMASFLEELGIPKDVIIAESRSVNTHENAVFTKQVLIEHRLQKILLVTSASHMPRAFASFRTEGISAIPSPTDHQIAAPNRYSVLSWLPDAESLATSTKAIHEYLGHVYYIRRGWIHH
jgi:uncharacterized SAM-binding protein YcdF (DUF218 family)